MTPNVRKLLSVAFTAMALDAGAVELAADGRGQALLFPYYTVRSTEGNPYNTYFSIWNKDPVLGVDQGKAVRVRFREARNGREVASINLFLAKGHIWTGALVPFNGGTLLISRDKSCADPPVGPAGLPFSSAGYTGANDDGSGAALDRTQEGFIEVLEMATVRNVAPFNALTAISPNFASNAEPFDCPRLRSPSVDAAPAGTFNAPSGGLSGTLTLINVANGQDFTVAAEALAGLSTRPYFRPVADSYPAFTANEIDPVSVVMSNGYLYRAKWPRGIDAVSAALARLPSAEFTIESATRSGTDFIVTWPTRHAYVSSTKLRSPPFGGMTWLPECTSPAVFYGGEPFSPTVKTREGAGYQYLPDGFGPVPSPSLMGCGATNVFTMTNPAGTAGRPVVGSRAGTVNLGGVIPVRENRPEFESGSVDLLMTGIGMTSLPDSTRMEIATGAITTGAQFYLGLPVTGLVVRSLANGTLSCGAAACQGNYGGAYPFTYERSITPAP